MRDEIELILPTSWKPNRVEFLATMGVSQGGLGAQLFDAVYNALFATSIDVKDEFKKYYSVEYSSLSDYVEIRYGEVLDDEQLEADQIFLVTWLPQILDIHYDNNKLDTVLKQISKLEEAQSENKA